MNFVIQGLRKGEWGVPARGGGGILRAIKYPAPWGGKGEQSEFPSIPLGPAMRNLYLTVFFLRQAWHNLGMEFEEAVREVASANGQEEALRQAYDIITGRYPGNRVKTYLLFWRLWEKGVEKLWRRNGFLHCNKMNFLLRELLVKSGQFKPSEVEIKWTLIWWFSPHQYLQVYYDKRGCEMGNSVIHFVRAQSEQRFKILPFEAAKSERGKLRPIPLGPAMRNLYLGKNRRINIDAWGKVYGIPFGECARGFR